MRYAVRPSLCPSSNCSIRALTLAAIASLEVCGFCGCCCWVFWINGLTVGVVVTVAVFMGASSCWAVALAVAVEWASGRYIHAERLLAKSGGSKAQWGGVSPTRRARESSDFRRKLWGNPLRRAWG